MPQIIHTADIHLGMKFSGLGRAGNMMRHYLKTSLTAVVDMVLERNADCLIIAGDLFDSKMVSDSTYRFVINELQRLNDKPVIIIPGTHDPANKDIIWDSFSKQGLPPNIYLILKPEQSPVTITEIDTTFWAKPNNESNSTQSPIPELADRSLSKYHVAVAHGSAAIAGLNPQNDYPFQFDEISKGAFNYVALGHWHSYKRLGESNAYYPGSPEQQRFGVDGSGGILLVDINESSVGVEQIKTGKTKWHDITLSTEIMTSPGDILKELESYAGDTSIARCKITGEQVSGVGFETEFLERELEDRFCFINISDETTADDLERLVTDFTPVTITGQFIQIIKERMESAAPEMKEVLAESLKLGCRLLSGNGPEK